MRVTREYTLVNGQQQETRVVDLNEPVTKRCFKCGIVYKVPQFWEMLHLEYFNYGEELNGVSVLPYIVCECGEKVTIT